jgi:hypothetical protein
MGERAWNDCTGSILSCWIALDMKELSCGTDICCNDEYSSRVFIFIVQSKDITLYII